MFDDSMLPQVLSINHVVLETNPDSCQPLRLFLSVILLPQGNPWKESNIEAFPMLPAELSRPFPGTELRTQCRFYQLEHMDTTPRETSEQ